jgi:hypothetical protein
VVKLGTNVKVHFFPMDHNKWADRYAIDMKKRGTFLGRIDYDDVEAVVEMTDFDFALSLPTVVAGVRAEAKAEARAQAKAEKAGL